jgi:predicted nucleic acid-binding protein/Arc/MetJ family transcription regulator
MGKTTVLIDEKLIQEALRATNLKTKKEVIEKGLRELLRMKDRELLRQELGTFDIDLSLEDLKKKRAQISIALKKNFHSSIKERIEQILIESDVAINGIIELELLGGARTEKEYERLKRRLDALYYIETTKLLWDDASRLAFDLKRKGINIPFTDILIAASAMREKTILLHADIHFDTIARHIDLKVESLVSRIN